MKINVVESQHESVIKALELGMVLHENMPGIENVYVEPTNSIFQNYDDQDSLIDQLPAVAINIEDEQVINETQSKASDDVFIDDDGKVSADGCCSSLFLVRQFLSVNIIVEQCEGVYAAAGTLSSSLEQIMRHLPNYKYNGNVVQQLDDSVSDDFYIKTYSYYFDYEKN